jgi:sortase family protein
MHKIYTSRYINTISLIITVIIFLISNTIYYIIQNPKILQIGIKNTVKVEFDDKTNISQNTTKENENNKTKEKTNSTNQTKEEKQAKTENATTKETNIKEKQWYLKIPRIFLEAEIAEGTTTEVMNTYIGHFEESAKKEGNICLAAHNRGYPVNYFQNLKLLKKGDKIEYKYQNFKKEYEVTENYIIKDTDWSCMEKTEENEITLITCIENEPEYRRCIKGIEKEQTKSNNNESNSKLLST